MLQDPVGSNVSGATLFWVRVVIYPALIRPSLKETLYQKAEVAILSVAGAVLLTFLFSMALFRSLGNIGHMLDRAASGEYELEILPSDKIATDELSVMASKVNLLGQRLRGAQFEVSDLRGNIDHLLQDLEDAVFIFNREFRLVFASGSVEKFLGRERSDLPGQSISSLFPPSTTLGLLVAQSSQTGRAIRNRRVPVAAANQTLSGPADRAAVRGHTREPAGRARRPKRSSGPAERPRSAAQDQPRTADRRPPVGHQPHFQRRRPRGQEPPQRDPAACRSGALQALPRRHRCRRTDGNHLARDSPPGPRGAHLPRFHAPRRVADGQRSDAGTGSARSSIWRARRPRPPTSR